MPKIAYVRAIFFLALAGFVPCAFAAGYNANWSGTVVSLNAYSYNDQLTFTLSTMPSLPSGTCSTTAFAVVGSDTDAESRDRIYATLLSAYLTGQTVSVGYDNTGASCADGAIEAFRVGF